MRGVRPCARALARDEVISWWKIFASLPDLLVRPIVRTSRRGDERGALSLFPTAAVCFYGSARLNSTKRDRPGNREEEGRIPRGVPRTTCRVSLDKTAKLPCGLTVAEMAVAAVVATVKIFFIDEGTCFSFTFLSEVAWWEENGCMGLLSLRSINPFAAGRLGRIYMYVCSRRVDAKYASEGRYESKVGLSSCT